jgi:uncharacterized protein YegJ (DUF2314 family)
MIARITAWVLLAFWVQVAATNAQVIDYKRGDPEMSEAISMASRTLPIFLQALARGTAEDFNLKIPLPHKGGRELIWMNEVRVDGKHFVGRIANTPVHQDRIHKGSPYRVRQSEIIDWYFMRDGKMHGSYTTRVMLKRMPPERARELQGILAPVPNI